MNPETTPAILPEELSQYLIQIADRIDSQSNPSRIQTASDLRALIAAVENTSGFMDFFRGIKNIFTDVDTDLAKSYINQAKGFEKELEAVKKVEGSLGDKTFYELFDTKPKLDIAYQCFSKIDNPFTVKHSPNTKKSLDDVQAVDKGDYSKMRTALKALDKQLVSSLKNRDKLVKLLDVSVDEVKSDISDNVKEYATEVNRIKEKRGQKSRFKTREENQAEKSEKGKKTVKPGREEEPDSSESEESAPPKEGPPVRESEPESEGKAEPETRSTDRKKSKKPGPKKPRERGTRKI